MSAHWTTPSNSNLVNKIPGKKIHLLLHPWGKHTLVSLQNISKEWLLEYVDKITKFVCSDQIKRTGYRIWENKNSLSLHWLKQCFRGFKWAYYSFFSSGTAFLYTHYKFWFCWGFFFLNHRCSNLPFLNSNSFSGVLNIKEVKT